MKIHFHGGAQTVTGSQHILAVNGTRILLECGLFQGRRNESYEKNQNLPFDPSSIDVCLLSHAHMDHSGNIPNLVKKGFRGSVYATPSTVELCRIMLRDSAFLQERDVEWVNVIRRRSGEAPLKPLYTIGEAEACMDSFVGIEYDRDFTVAPGVNVTFRDAGHILGAAGILLEIQDKGKTIRLGYSGDVGRPGMPIMHDPNVLRDLDALMIECTYGNRLHAMYEDVEEELAVTVKEVAAKGGKIIIPAFAVGRTQLIVYILHKLFDENRIPDMPIFVDSPMACKATDIFRKHTEMMDRETERFFLADNRDPFDFPRLKYVQEVEASKRLNGIRYPHIIISASGMAEGGRILHHLRNNIENHRNLILFVGYAARETLARKIMDGERTVKIFGEEHKVKARVKIIDAFSAHADRRELLKYVDINKPSRLKHLFLVHGETDQAKPLRDALRSKGYRDVRIPDVHDVAEI